MELERAPQPADLSLSSPAAAAIQTREHVHCHPHAHPFARSEHQSMASISPLLHARKWEATNGAALAMNELTYPHHLAAPTPTKKNPLPLSSKLSSPTKNKKKLSLCSSFQPPTRVTFNHCLIPRSLCSSLEQVVGRWLAKEPRPSPALAILQ